MEKKTLHGKLVRWVSNEDVVLESTEILKCVTSATDSVPHYFKPEHVFSFSGDEYHRSYAEREHHCYVFTDELPGEVLEKMEVVTGPDGERREMLTSPETIKDPDIFWNKVSFDKGMVGHAIIFRGRERLYFSSDWCRVYFSIPNVSISLGNWRIYTLNRWRPFMYKIITEIEFKKGAKIDLEELGKKWDEGRVVSHFVKEFDENLAYLNHSFNRQGKKRNAAKTLVNAQLVG